MASQPRWYEIFIEAAEEDLDALRRDAEAATGEKPLSDRDLHLPPETFADRVRELLGAKSHHLLFASAAPARELVRAARSRPRVRLEGVREIDRGSFSFQAEVYSRELADQIRRDLLADLPPGVSLAGAGDAEETHPEDRGLELYSPAHDYVCHLQGTLTGPLPGILEMWRRSREMDFTREESLRFEGRDVAPESM